MTDTDRNLLAARVYTADIQDCDWAAGVIDDAKKSFPTLSCLFADGGYAGDRLEVKMIRIDGPAIKIVRRPSDAKGFVVIARRWVVERTRTWIGGLRRLSRRVARQAEQAREF